MHSEWRIMDRKLPIRTKNKMDDLPSAAKWCSALALVLLCACSTQNPSHSLSEPSGQIADHYSEWVPSGYQCKWGPESSGFPANQLIEQYGACGMTRTRTITPAQFDPVTGMLHTSGMPYQVTQMDDPKPSGRRIYADFYRRFSPQLSAATPRKDGVVRVGALPGTGKLGIIEGGDVAAYLIGNDDHAAGILSASGFSSAGQAANWLARYSFVDFTDSEGKPISTFGIDFLNKVARASGAKSTDSSGAAVRLSPVPGGQKIEAFFLKWKKNPQMVYGLRLHNR